MRYGAQQLKAALEQTRIKSTVRAEALSLKKAPKCFALHSS
jgi:hypothetical protein